MSFVCVLPNGAYETSGYTLVIHLQKSTSVRTIMLTTFGLGLLPSYIDRKGLYHLLLLVIGTVVFAPQAMATKVGPISKPQRVVWQSAITITTGEAPVSRLTFQEASHTPQFGFNPTINLSFDHTVSGNFELRNCTYQSLNKAELSLLDTTEIKPVVDVKQDAGIARGLRQHHITIHPFKRGATGFLKLTNYSYRWVTTHAAEAAAKAGGSGANKIQSAQQWAPSSALSRGTWYKLGITTSGIYKLDRSYLAGVLGLDANGIDPRNIQVYGHGGLPLPSPNAILRPTDIPQVPIWVSGEVDGRLDANDYLLFYGQGTTEITTDIQNQRLGHRLNIYADTAYYYLTVGSAPGLRIQDVPSISPGTQTLTTVDHLEFWEVDQFNLLKSGREWYGDNFDFVTNRNYNFSTDGILAGTQAQIRLQTLATGLRCSHRSTFTVAFNQDSIGKITQTHNCPYSLAVLGTNVNSTFNVNAPTSGGITLGLTYKKAGFNEAVGYLNWIEVQTRRSAQLRNNYLELFSFESTNQQISTYQIGNATNDIQVWDVTNPSAPERQTVSNSGGNATFDFASDQLKRFVAFGGNNFAAPRYLGQQQNQDLHGIATPELIIITASVFSDQAQRLAAFRRQHDGLSVQTVTTAQIYAEFSSGKQDLGAIRDFLRSLYFKDPSKLKYVLLFGDCSFDYKQRILNNTNYVPIFQSVNVLNPINSYGSDDYIAFMDDREGQWLESQLDLIDVSIGRLIVKSSAEASDVVDKLMGYRNTPLNLGNWRTRFTMAADNGDGLLHFFDAEQVVSPFESRFSDYNVNKIYVAAYPVQSSPLGSVSPAATAALNASVNQGSLVVDYAGHGNEFQWASEQLLTIDGIKRNWNNPNNLPLFVTATCDFGRYDDPTLVSGGEFILLSQNKCGIGLVTTTRPVYANNNLALNRALVNALYTKTGKFYPRLGDAVRTCKNSSVVYTPPGSDAPGNRSFALLGDPSMRLAYPRYPITINSITNQNGVRTDTIRALDLVRINGSVLDDEDSVMRNFNGELFCTVYDKPTRINLSEGSINTSFLVRNSIIYSGTATVTNGQFSLSFVTPLDINYLVGNGKISLYAKDNNLLTDAVGNDISFKIGGSNESSAIDALPPTIKPYINDTTFQNGGLAGVNSTYLAHISDENGINLATSGIGHEMMLTIDEDPNKTYVVSNYFVSEPNTFKSGWLSFPLTDLAVGRHTAKLIVWDTHNNSSVRNLDFVVGAKEADVKIEKFSTYPNPIVRGGVLNFVYSHTLAGQTVKSEIEILDASGRFINKINYTSENAASTLGANGELIWDLTTASGQVLTGGTYFARLKVTGEAGQFTNAVIRVVVLP